MSGVCAKTGLAYINGPILGYRLAKTSYGPINPLERPDGAADRSTWSRFDTSGSTIYLAGDAATAYAETLAMARTSRQYRDAISYVADFFSISREEAQQQVNDDWAANNNMVPGWLPRTWRDSRLLYVLQVEEPIRWIDLTAAETIAALNIHLGAELEARTGVQEITLGTVAGDNRQATTLIAEWIRDQVLDDGSYAAGVQAHSKYGGGLCWAYWLRRRDDGLGDDAVSIVDESAIELTDSDLQRVLDRYGINAR